jgi:phosphoribosylglycinamide formyltransferase-1
MRMIGPETLKRFPRRMLNIHPALLPKFGGQGMYGDLVHEAVLAANEQVSGATVHLVDDQYDHGEVVMRREAPVLPGDDLAALRERVRAIEGPLYVEALAAIASGAIELDG